MTTTKRLRRGCWGRGLRCRPLPQTPSPARRCNNTLTKAEAVPSKFVPPKGFTSQFGTTSVQLRERKKGLLAPKRHQMKHLDFLIAFFGTRRSVVQIHSPRPILSYPTTYKSWKRERPPGKK